MKMEINMDRILDTKILQVDNVDLMGQRFNGHDLQITLNELGYNASQVVQHKTSTDRTTVKLGDRYTKSVERYILSLEKKFSMNNLLGCWDRYLESSKEFQNADIVHYHKIHTGIVPMLSFQRLVSKKPSVWTIHDPWMITGHCVNPLECTKWRIGCKNCPHVEDYYFTLQQDKSDQLWNIKKQVYSQLDVDIIISTKFMENYLNNSPLSSCFKRVHKIPFGIKLDIFNTNNKQKARDNWKISKQDIVIGFRCDNNYIKGCQYIYEALSSIDDNRIVLLTIGNGILPYELKSRFRSIELGWQDNETIVSDFFSACDIFLMPSLAESFGLMAIEAMASECAIIVFKDTVLEEIVDVPNGGVSVEYKNSKAIRQALIALINNNEVRIQMGKKGREIVEIKYNYKDYVRKHIELYENIKERKL